MIWYIIGKEKSGTEMKRVEEKCMNDKTIIKTNETHGENSYMNFLIKMSNYIIL